MNEVYLMSICGAITRVWLSSPGQCQYMWNINWLVFINNVYISNYLKLIFFRNIRGCKIFLCIFKSQLSRRRKLLMNWNYLMNMQILADLLENLIYKFGGIYQWCHGYNRLQRIPYNLTHSSSFILITWLVTELYKWFRYFQFID